MSASIELPVAPRLQFPAPPSIETIAINTIRTLSIDAIQAANSGHPGTPMGMAVLPPNIRARVSVEEASDFGWSKYTGSDGAHLCIESFGASAPLKHLLKKFGFTAEHVVAAAKDQLGLHVSKG